MSNADKMMNFGKRPARGRNDEDYQPRRSPSTFSIPLDYKTDVIDAIDNWLKSYKNYHYDKCERQRIRMIEILKVLGAE